MLGTLTTHKEQGDSQRSELYISQFTCELIKLFHAILKILLVFFHVGIFFYMSFLLLEFGTVGCHCSCK